MALPRSLRPHEFLPGYKHKSVCWCGKSEAHSIHHHPMPRRVHHPYTDPMRCAKCGKRLTLTYYLDDGLTYGPVCFKNRRRTS